jgi:sugar phosphate isomerase/epimerase
MGVNNKREPLMMEVGEGNLNWPEILKACKAAGVRWYIIEQDVCQRDPFESLEISLKNVREMGVGG